MECRKLAEILRVHEMNSFWSPPGAIEDRKRQIREHKENCIICSGKYEIVPLAEIHAHNLKENPIVTLNAVKESDGYYFITYDCQKGGYLGKTEHAAANLLRDAWGSWIDFKSLAK